MKNKESQKRLSTTKSNKITSKNAKDSIAGKLAPKVDRNETGIYQKSRVDRLKKFYQTTKWLPNSAFTTYFGKPAFENYGYGNTKPVYGGLFYGNYMLSHNINPMDGGNLPPEKQVYSSAMLKSIQRNDVRKPQPPRKVPDEIRNTPEELEEIKNRNPIFQLPNHFPGRDILKPDLLKARYFRSGKNTPENETEDYGLDQEVDVFDIEDVLNNKKLKKKKLNSKIETKFDPYEQGKIKLGKKKMKDELIFKQGEYTGTNNNVTKDDFYNDEAELKTKKSTIKLTNKEENDEFHLKKQFYERMLKEDCNNDEGNKSREEKEIQTGEYFYPVVEERKESSSKCNSLSKNENIGKLKKKENPCISEPGEFRQNFICCIHDTNKLSVEEMDPKLFKNMPPCIMTKITPAGKPLKRSDGVGSLFN